MRSRIRGRKAALLVGLLVLIAGAGALHVTWEDFRLWYRLRPDFELHRWRNGQGRPEYRHRATGIIFVHLPGGTFRMGNAPHRKSPTGTKPMLNPAVRRSIPRSVADDRLDHASPQHQVTLSPFLIAKYEVSQSEWERVMRSNRSRLKGDRLPVENVSWLDCQKFCASTSLQLPTEAQWEYACRAGTYTLYAFGESVSTDSVNFDEDVFDAAEPPTVPVDAGPPNGFGLHNVHGNVWEWCEDIFDATFYSKSEATGLDPVSTAERPSGTDLRVVRGGAWANDAWACRSAHRAWATVSEGDGYTGFRPVFPLR